MTRMQNSAALLRSMLAAAGVAMSIASLPAQAGPVVSDPSAPSREPGLQDAADVAPSVAVVAQQLLIVPDHDFAADLWAICACFELNHVNPPAIEILAVPEPSSLALLGLGAAGLAATRRRRPA